MKLFRHKVIDLDDGKWDLIELPNLTAEQVQRYFAQTQGSKYDWWGMLGIAFGIKQKRTKYFAVSGVGSCSDYARAGGLAQMIWQRLSNQMYSLKPL